LKENSGKNMREDAKHIINESIAAVLPGNAVIKALSNRSFSKDVYCIAIGKAAWNMAFSAKQVLGRRLSKGLVITKYNHLKGQIPGFEMMEAGHPIPDENSVYGAKRALNFVSGLPEGTDLLFLLSGGGSSLFEKPLGGVTLEEMKDITSQLLHKGAGILEINTVRKHISAVKGGRFATACRQLRILSIILSDVPDDRPDSVASGPVAADQTTSEQALSIIDQYKIQISEAVRSAIRIETPKKTDHCEYIIIGSGSLFCQAAAKSAAGLGYHPVILTTKLDCEAREAGRFMASIIRSCQTELFSCCPDILKKPCAIIAGGETLVKVTGKGLGGRNQETALSAAIGIKDLNDVLFFSIGSDGTDGPTDAAGGIVDGSSAKRIAASGKSPQQYLNENDSYHALQYSGDLIITGATGTNVNDILVALCK
jgi:glycerate 2-kinase